MGKRQLNLYIDDELIELAKTNPNIDSISKEFNEWLKFRVGQMSEPENVNVDYDKEVARLRQEISKLESKKAIKKTDEMKDKEKIMVVDHIIDNQLEYDKPDVLPEKRFKGLMFLFDKKFRIKLSDQEAKDILSNRIKERGL